MVDGFPKFGVSISVTGTLPTGRVNSYSSYGSSANLAPLAAAINCKCPIRLGRPWNKLAELTWSFPDFSSPMTLISKIG